MNAGPAPSRRYTGGREAHCKQARMSSLAADSDEHELNIATAPDSAGERAAGGGSADAGALPHDGPRPEGRPPPRQLHSGAAPVRVLFDVFRLLRRTLAAVAQLGQRCLENEGTIPRCVPHAAVAGCKAPPKRCWRRPCRCRPSSLLVNLTSCCSCGRMSGEQPAWPQQENSMDVLLSSGSQTPVFVAECPCCLSVATGLQEISCRQQRRVSQRGRRRRSRRAAWRQRWSGRTLRPKRWRQGTSTGCRWGCATQG